MFKTIKIDDGSTQRIRTSSTNKECKLRKNYEETNVQSSRVQLETIVGLIEISNNLLREIKDNPYLIEIKKKISSYSYQDAQIKLRKTKVNKVCDRNTILDTKTTIKLTDVLKKIVDSELLCSYCKCELLVLYKERYQENQWTLDRIDNELYHTNDNCVISCLSCNKMKRRRDDDKFRFSQQMTIKKME